LLEKETELQKIKVDIVNLRKASTSYLQKVTPVKKKSTTEEPIWFLTDEEVQDLAKNMTDSTITNLKISKDNKNLDDFKRELQKNYENYVAAEQELKRKRQPKEAFVEEMKTLEKNMIETLLDCLVNNLPSLAPIGEAALKHTMKCYNNEKQKMYENNMQRSKAAEADNVETENIQKFVLQVITAYDKLKTWKSNFFDNNRQHFLPEDAVRIDEQLESYHNKLNEFLGVH
jgi:hypothetical protein